MSNLPNVARCTHCGSTNLTWDHTLELTNDVAQARLRTTDLRCIFFLGCNDCSETLALVKADKVAAEMTDQRATHEGK